MTEFEKPAPVNLVFDLDGTLTDPALGFVRCINYALTEHGLSNVPEDELKKYIGPPLDGTFREILKLDDTDNVNSFVSKYRDRYYEVGYRENIIYEGIPEALLALKSLGMTMGVCTSKRTDLAELILDRFDILDNFQFVNGADIGTVKSEQLAVLSLRGHVNNQSIMIGDRAIDIISAHKNNMRSAGVLYGYGDWDEIIDARPDWCVELPEYLVDTFAETVSQLKNPT